MPPMFLVSGYIIDFAWFLPIENTALTSLKKQKAEKHLLLSYFPAFGTVSFVLGSREVLSALFTKSSLYKLSYL